MATRVQGSSALAAREDLPDWVPRRQRIWQLGGGVQCSIVGTCLSHEDLLRTARKCGVRIPHHLTAYDIHGFIVKEASAETKVAAALQKLLDKRYAAPIARLGECRSAADRVALWVEESEAGRVAGAYWAFMTDIRVESALFKRIFGEVHMLSHVQGRVAHQNLTKLSEQQATIDHLEGRLGRLSSRNRSLAAERDAAAAAAALAQARQAARPERPSPVADGPRTIGSIVQSRGAGQRPLADLEQRLTRKERALVAARERARGAEQQVRQLQERIDRLQLLIQSAGRGAALPCPAAEACLEEVRRDLAMRVLYLGGRSGMIEPLRRVAEDCRAQLVHHDGGHEQAVTRIDSLIESCDAVFCPIDCVSHAACVRAKAICKRLQKPFVPLRSSGASTFQRALSALSAG